MKRRPPRSTQSRSSAASDVYKRQPMLGYYIQKETSILNHCFDLAAITYHSLSASISFTCSSSIAPTACGSKSRNHSVIRSQRESTTRGPKPAEKTALAINSRYCESFWGNSPALSIQPCVLNILIASFGCPAKHPSQKRIAGWLPDFVQDTRGERCSL